MAFDGIEITNRGRNLLAKAEAGLTKITYTKFSVGDGKLSGQLQTALKALINEKVSFPVSRLKIQSENVVVPGFEFSNQGITSGFFFREVGMWATDPDLGEILYAYANSGDGAEYIDAQNASAVLKKLFNLELTVSNTAQVTVVVDDSIIYATPQDVANALKESKGYTDTAINNVKVPDATTTVKGIVRLSADYKSQSATTVPNSKALFDMYNISLVDRGNVFQSNFNFALAVGVWRVNSTSLNPVTDNSPPEASSKGVLFVTSSTGTDGLTVVQVYVDDTGRIFKRVRTVAGAWLDWNELANKNHTHTASDLPSASTQAKGIVQLNTSTSSTATDQAATPSAVKAAYDRADQAFTQASDLKSKVANAITGKGGSANSGMTGDQLAAAITNLPVKRWATGTFNGQTASAISINQDVSMQLSVNSTAFSPSRIFVKVKLDATNGTMYIDAWATCVIGSETAISGRFDNKIRFYNFTQQAGGFSVTMYGSRIQDYAGGAQ
ncbi:tail fiber protein [Paenibacillus farraposensis]|uniref:tail fiber protein n=1 Tax=Paenibacillus farraposensis TaxID=2807095 RepID=UPI003606D8B4